MKPKPPDLLVAEVLADDDIFRAATLRQTVSLARRRRRVRFAQRSLALLAVVCAAAFLLRPPPPALVPVPVAGAPHLEFVRTVPLAAKQLVQTQRALFAPVATERGGVARIASQPGGVLVIATRTAAPKFDYLSDQQLLAAFPGEHPVLIASGTPEARLVFH